MQLLIKVYENYRSTSESFNFFTTEKVIITKNLDSFDTAEFMSSWYEIVEYNKIEIYEAGNPDILVFKWLVYEPEKDISILKNETRILCRSERAIMDDRKVLVERDKSATVSSIVDELLQDYNMEGRSYNVAFPDTINIEYSVWDEYSRIFDEIALQVWWYRDVQNGVVVMDYLLWSDKSFGSNRVDVLFTKSNGDNVDNVNIKWQSTRANIIIWDDGNTTHIEQNLTEWVVYGVKKERFLPWDLIQKTKKLLEKMNIRQRILNIKLDPNKNINAVVWDKLYVEISNVNDLEDIKWEVLVVKSETIYDNAQKQRQLFVWENVIQWDSLGDLITSIRNDINKIS